MTLVKKIAMWIVLAPLIGLIAVVAIPIGLLVHLQGAISLRLFCRRERGHVFLVCSARRDWNDFLKNNVIPVLPAHFRTIWHTGGRGGECAGLLSLLARKRIFGVSKPYIVVVTDRALLHESLNLPLQAFKKQRKRSEAVQAACTEIIREVEARVRAGDCVHVAK